MIGTYNAPLSHASCSSLLASDMYGHRIRQWEAGRSGWPAHIAWRRSRTPSGPSVV